MVLNRTNNKNFKDNNSNILTCIGLVYNRKIQKGRNDMKRMKGITLIALVITIIVLLILAGVAISTLTGDGSIIKNANEAVAK